ncbi:DUF6236 family protein [Cronobacter dublinensis]
MKRGMIITSNIEIDASTNKITYNSGFNQKSLRYGVLYLDEICVSKTNVINAALPEDMEQLKKEKIIVERITKATFSHGFDMAGAMLNAYLKSFEELNQRKNETWCLNKELKIINDRAPFIDYGGESLTFLNALPVPDEDFPLGDLYEFRQKRNDERKELMNSIDRLRLSVMQAENKGEALTKGLLEVESNLLAMNKLIKETKRGFYLSHLSLDYSTQDMIETFKKVYNESSDAGMGKLSSFLCGIGATVTSGFNVKGGYRYKQEKPQSPYFYAAEISHKFSV